MKTCLTCRFILVELSGGNLCVISFLGLLKSDLSVRNGNDMCFIYNSLWTDVKRCTRTTNIRSRGCQTLSTAAMKECRKVVGTHCPHGFSARARLGVELGLWGRDGGSLVCRSECWHNLGATFLLFVPYASASRDPEPWCEVEKRLS